MIIDDARPNRIKLKDLNEGEFFEHDKCLFILIDKCSADGICLVFDCCNNMVDQIGEYEEILKLKGKIVIE